MSDILILRVAWLLAFVFSAVKQTPAKVATIEHAIPFLNLRCLIFFFGEESTCLLTTTFAANDLFLNLPAITSCLDRYFASTTEAFVARSFTQVFTTRHHFATNFAAAPTVLIVSINTTLGDFLPTAKTALYGAHLLARRAWTCMA